MTDNEGILTLIAFANGVFALVLLSKPGEPGFEAFVVSLTLMVVTLLLLLRKSDGGDQPNV